MSATPNNEPRPKRILQDEVCERFGGITRNHLRSLVKKNRIRALRVSRNVLSFLEADVEEFIRRNEVGAAAPTA